MRKIKGKSKELLFSDGNHLLLIFAVIFGGASVMMPFIAANLIGMFLGDGALFAVWAISFGALTMPMIFGVYRVAGMAVRSKGPTISEAFFAFSSLRRYLRVLILGFFSFIKALLWLTPPLRARFYAVTYFAVAKDESFFTAIGHSWRVTKKNGWRLTRLSLSQLPLTVISLLAVLMPYVAYTAPLRACTYAVACASLENTSQKINDPTTLVESTEEINEQYSE